MRYLPPLSAETFQLTERPARSAIQDHCRGNMEFDQPLYVAIHNNSPLSIRQMAQAKNIVINWKIGGLTD